MQCSLMKLSCCCLTPKFLFMLIGFLCFALGLFSVVWPRRSIALYQKIMELFNWRVMPIDEAREVRNTPYLGGFLAFLAVVLIVGAYLKL